MTGPPHQLGRITPLTTLRPQVPDDLEMNFWQEVGGGLNKAESSLVKASS